MQDYINGSNILVGYTATDTTGATYVATGHCTSNTIDFSTETKERAVKPAASTAAALVLFKEKGVTAQSVSISGDGLVFDGDDEHGFNAFLAAYKAHKSIHVRAFARGNTTKPFLEGKFAITSLSLSAPAQDDSTYSYTLENDGAVTITPENFAMPTTDQGL